jgi:hypothetical protein
LATGNGTITGTTLASRGAPNRSSESFPMAGDLALAFDERKPQRGFKTIQ